MKKLIYTLVLCLILNSAFLIQNLQSQWVQMSSGISGAYINCIASAGSNILAGVNGGIYVSNNYGANWSIVNPGNYPNVNTIVNINTNVYAGTNQGFSSSTNNGASWYQSPGTGNMLIYAITSIGNTIYAGTWLQGVFTSTNNGANWSQTSLNNKSVISLVVSGTYIFAGTYDLGGVWVSQNNGASWSQTSLNNRSVKTLAVKDNNIYAGTNDYGIYVSTNNGTNWSQTSLTGKTISSIVISSNYMIAGAGNYPINTGGVYLSSNNGISWIYKNQGFSQTPSVEGLLVANNYIFSCTQEISVWRRSLTEIIGIHNISTEIPSAYSLSQNYPNPFNPKTVIRFGIPSLEGYTQRGVGMVTLKVYNIMGREIATLVNEKLQPGTYETTFDGTALSSGTYFYKLTSGDFTVTKKLTLLK